VHELSPRPGDLETIETASTDGLRALQLERLRWTVRYTYVPHQRASLAAVGVHPDDVRDLADLAKLPFTAKADRVTVAVEVAAPGMVERSAGKMRRTVDKRPAR
jgi:phenylacetate-coenzyme A ligase PaaK-like adenylate-forming protein